MDLKKIDLNKLQDYAFTANEIAMSPVSSWNNKFINIKCLDNESIIPTVQAIPLDKIKEARKEIKSISLLAHADDESFEIVETDGVLAILDRLIAESEGEYDIPI